MGWGSYPDVDAAAKIAQLLQDDGVFQGQQLLSPVKTREAMRRTSVSESDRVSFPASRLDMSCICSQIRYNCSGFENRWWPHAQAAH